MSSSDSQGAGNICDLPPELLLQITQYLSFKDHSRWILVDRRHKDALDPILYLRLRASRTELPHDVEGQDEAAHRDHVTRESVVEWAVGNGMVGTLEKVDQIEDIGSFLDITVISAPPESFVLTLIHQAAARGHADVIKYLLLKGAYVNTPLGDDLLPMHMAKTGEVVRLLSAHGGSLEPTPSGTSALTSSILYWCEASAVTAFLQLGVDHNHVAEDGMTAPEAAIVRGNVDALRVLLEAGVDPNKLLPTGGSLLYKAIWLGSRDHNTETARSMATLLLDRGASPNSSLDETIQGPPTSEPCSTPTLFTAVMMQFSGSVSLVKLLLERGADQNAPYTPYRRNFYANGSSLRGFDMVLAPTLIANLLAAMLNSIPHDPDPEGMEKLTLLVRHGADVDTLLSPTPKMNTIRRDRTLLSQCLAQDGSRAERALQFITPLLELGADPNWTDPDGNAPLHLLCGSFFATVQKNWLYAKHIRLAKAQPSPLTSLIDGLIARGADVNARDAKGRTPLMLLLRHPASVPTALLVDALLRHPGVDVGAVDEHGCTALHYATGDPANPFQHEPVFRLQLLLQRGMEAGSGLDVNAYSGAGKTPLHVLLEARDKSGRKSEDAYEKRRRVKSNVATKIRALSMLIRAGADVRKQTRLPRELDAFKPVKFRGETPLHLALKDGEGVERLSVVRLLLQHGAVDDVNYASSNSGFTPLMTVAVAAGRGELSRNATEELIRLLLAAGADAGMRDAKGRTAWDVFVDAKGPLPSISPWPLCFKGVAPQTEGVGGSGWIKDALGLSLGLSSLVI